MSYAIINLIQKVLELLSKGDAKDTDEKPQVHFGTKMLLNELTPLPLNVSLTTYCIVYIQSIYFIWQSVGGHPFDFTREGAVSSRHLQGQYKQPCIPRSSTSRPGENSFVKYRVWILHLLDHAPLDGCVANLDYSDLK